MAHRLYEISLKAIIKNPQGEALILLENGQTKGFYDFPGGRIEEGEEHLEFSDILSREIFEEVGDIKFTINKKPCALGRHTYLKDGVVTKHLIWIFFEAKYLEGDIKISQEHDDYKWVKLEEIDLEKYFTRGSLDGIKNYLGK